tara:strand:+ start:395 stop:859 length:465 start_codon:yes stop_codon:yes gene_type:complete
MDKVEKKGRGGARIGAGRKKGVGLTYDIQKHCQKFIEEILKDDAIKLIATKQLSEKLSQEDIDENYLYLIYMSGKYKIGFSSNWKKRMKSYKTHSPEFETVYICKSKIAFLLESELHEMFSDKRINGEWFELNNNDVLNAVLHCNRRSNLDLFN